ncbi:MAG: tRNA 2-thiouridine synthesizing protein A [Dinoroseobacter sp.]|jgi:tRNA 2-thiouridine synthesizing protein A
MSDAGPLPLQLDCRRLLCPMPVIRVQDAIKKLREGEQLVATCTDPGVRSDVPTWCRINGHEIIDIAEDGTEIVITIAAHPS